MTTHELALLRNLLLDLDADRPVGVNGHDAAMALAIVDSLDRAILLDIKVGEMR